MAQSVLATFVSQKISKIRWKNDPQQITGQAELFFTGTWDDDKNQLSLWCNKEEVDVDEEDMTHSTGEPKQLLTETHAGHVTDLQCMEDHLIVATSSLGHVTVYKHNVAAQKLSIQRRWTKLHHLPRGTCSCTAVAVKLPDTIVSAGEDGVLQVLSLDHTDPIRTIEKADSSTMTAIKYLKQSEVAAVNSIGQLKIWDLRDASQKPSRMFLMSGDCIGLQCLDVHPTQPHIVATGGQDGGLAIWDMRQDRYPVTLLAAHSSHMWEVKFHPTHPDNLFTCSEDGSIWHWDGTSINAPAGQTFPISIANSGQVKGSPEGFSSSWLASDATKHRLDITDLIPENKMPINSLDIHNSTLVCGTDAEQIVTINNMHIK